MWRATLELQCFNQQLVDNSLPYSGGRFQMVVHCSERSPSYPDGTRHSVVHECIDQRLGSTLECKYGVRYMDNKREKQFTSTCSSWNHTQSHTPLAEEANRRHSPGCVRQPYRSVLHQQPGRNTVNTTVQTDQEATPHVSGQPDNAPSTTNPREIECSFRHPVTPSPDVRYIMVSTPI